MDVREKLVELLTNSPQLDVLDWSTGWEEAASYLITHGVTVQEWISVKDRLPEKEGTYLTYTDKEAIHLDCFCIYPNHGTQFWVSGNGKVTHWMSLPQPPAEVVK